MGVISGGCFCGDVKYQFKDDTIILSAYCHCTNCQRLTAGSSVHSIHIPDGNMTINGEVDTFEFVSNTRKRRYRCKRCGTQFASFNVDKKKWSIWSSTVNKTDGKLPSSIAATAHMFYGTRQFDVNDNLGKWEGYADKSQRIA